MEFASKGTSGTGGGFRLAVYPGRPPSSLFQGSDVKFGSTAISPKSWTRKDPSVTLEPLPVPIKFKTPVREFSVVLVGLDQWIDTSVKITIDSLKVSKQISPPPRSRK